MSSNYCLTGLSGQRYSVAGFSMDGTTWHEVAGVYAFAAIGFLGVQILYIGKCNSFKSRMTILHEKWSAALAMGATHVLAVAIPGPDSVRDAAEKDLIRAYNPSLNVHHNALAGLAAGLPLSAPGTPTRRGIG